jgi:hypothetical protein
MKRQLIDAARGVSRRFGFDLVRYYLPNSHGSVLSDLDPASLSTIRKVAPYTLTSAERIFALCEATRYIARNKIPGAIVECGVWKGGSMMSIAYTLLEVGDPSRELYLFDTFEGMTEPTVRDKSRDAIAARQLMSESSKDVQDSVWCYAPLDEVKQAMSGVGYDMSRLHFVKGRVEDTLPAAAPDAIALLRLDTDWYESTRHELIHLFPRLVAGGVLVIDDYGHWEGARQAVDEYVRDHDVTMLLNRVDYTGRIGIKQR